MRHTQEELMEALRQLDSMHRKIEAALASLQARPDPSRCKPQITLARRRLEAINVSQELIIRELTTAPDWRFRPLKKAEITDMQALIHQRIAWMDKVGLRQWNVTDYGGVYPPEYYAACWQRGELFALADAGTGQIICVGCLKKADDRWPDGHGVPALYLHHLAADLHCKGAGAAFLRAAEAHARKSGCRCFRLDSAADNPVLAAWYEKQGYEPAGTCVDGLYEGVLWEKPL